MPQSKAELMRKKRESDRKAGLVRYSRKIPAKLAIKLDKIIQNSGHPVIKT
jgi:hypothetical protein